MAIMHYSLEKHFVPMVQEFITSPLGRRGMDDRRQAVEEHAYRLCRCMHVWLHTNAMAVLLRTMSGIGDMANPRVNRIAFSDPCTYTNAMDSITGSIVARKYGSSSRAMLVWGGMASSALMSMERAMANVVGSLAANDAGQLSEEDEEQEQSSPFLMIPGMHDQWLDELSGLGLMGGGL